MEIVEEKKVIDTTEENKEAKKARKPREKVRTIEECYDLSVSKLTDKEKDNLIKALKENLNLATNQTDAFKKNAEAAFEKIRLFEEQYKAMEKYYKERLRFIDLQVQAFTTSVNQAIRGGIE